MAELGKRVRGRLAIVVVRAGGAGFGGGVVVGRGKMSPPGAMTCEGERVNVWPDMMTAVGAEGGVKVCVPMTMAEGATATGMLLTTIEVGGMLGWLVGVVSLCWGDVSGCCGDVSGSCGDVSGSCGDVSGWPAALPGGLWPLDGAGTGVGEAGRPANIDWTMAARTELAVGKLSGSGEGGGMPGVLVAGTGSRWYVFARPPKSCVGEGVCRMMTGVFCVRVRDF